MARQGLSLEQLRELARSAAADALRELRAQVSAIERTFPELATPGGRARTAAQVRKRTRTMSAAARKEVSQRMKKYWSERRKAKAKA